MSGHIRPLPFDVVFDDDSADEAADLVCLKEEHAPIGAGDAPIGSMSIDKMFHGDLQGVSAGQMLALRSGVEGSAGYVAMERVTATLGGRQGSFTLQHSGLMDKGTQSLTVIVVPDSATGGLLGLTGTMNIVVTPGRHDYEFRYTLPA
ncbi:DUF3224 domain-containing protein [Pseudomonas sp. 3A(2025)]